MRILIFGINYSPEKTGIGPYTAGLAEHLAEEGHHVEVITGLPSYPEWAVHDEFRHLIWSRNLEEGVCVHRRWHYVPRTQSALRRLAYEGTFLLTGLSFAVLPKPDLILGIIPALSGGVLARLAARRFGVPYALIFQDLMGPAASQTGVSGAGRVASLVTSLERWVSRQAAALGIIADGFRPYIESLGVERERIKRVRNWARVKDCTEDRAATRQRLGWEGRLVCLHAGNLGHKQGLENVVECALLAQTRGKALHFVFVGEGNKKADLESLAKVKGVVNVEFLPLQSEYAFTNILAAADILLLNQRTGVSEMALPSKLTSYLASGRPTVAAVDIDSESARELMAAEAGLVVKPDDPTALLSVISHLTEDSGKRELLGKNGKVHALNVLSAHAALLDLKELLLNTRMVEQEICAG